MLTGYKPSSGKKWIREDQLPLREAITGSNKGVEVHSTEAIFASALPLAVNLFSLAHRNNRAPQSKGVTVFVSALASLPACHFSLQSCIVYWLQMWTANGQTKGKKRETI